MFLFDIHVVSSPQDYFLNWKFSFDLIEPDFASSDSKTSGTVHGKQTS